MAVALMTPNQKQCKGNVLWISKQLIQKINGQVNPFI